MTKYRFWMGGIIVLVALNIALMAFIWYDRAPRADRPPDGMAPPGRPGGDFMVRELELNPEQARTVRALHEQQVLRSDTIRAEIRRLYKEIVTELFSAAPDSSRIRQLSDAIGSQQAEFDRGSFNIFLEIKRICDAGQQEKLQRLITELLMRSLPSPPPDLKRHDLYPPPDAQQPGPPAGNPPPPDKDRLGP
ncbi:MAG: periplasmic heavy metal sensor [candidate division Zixibacteria bacterium]|nr:periplasmic heavy metal sensor [candidate division Zixibacteria bacterium]